MEKSDYILQNLSFREATHLDIPSIVSIHNSNVRTHLKSLERGFLLAEIDRNSVLGQMNLSNRYFVATQPDNEILGYVCISKPKISTEMLNKIKWNDETFKPKLQDKRHLFLQVVATQKQCSGQGVAQFMYRSLYQTFPNSFISLFVVVNPIMNHRSMDFHLKQGFKKIGILKSDRFLDLINYEDALMFKET
jgi:L-amino acid N-acyltransferase YncA